MDLESETRNVFRKRELERVCVMELSFGEVSTMEINTIALGMKKGGRQWSRNEEWWPEVAGPPLHYLTSRKARLF